MGFLVKNKLFIWLVITLAAFTLISVTYYIRLTNVKSSSKNSSNTSGLLSFEEFIASQNEDEFKIFPDDTCQPKRNVLFIKGHDSNSTGVQNLFFHYGDRDDLAIILVDMEEYYAELKTKHSLKKSLPLNPNHHSETLFSTRTDIPIAAVKQNYETMKSILPADTIFLTDLTDTVSLTDWYFQKTRHKELNQDKSLLLEQLEIFLVDPLSSLMHGFQQNLMSIELGFDKQHVNDQNQITQFIQTVDSQFHFVMIEEQIDEVLVHLHHLLCWPLDDLIIFRHRLRLSRSPHQISKELTEKIRSHHNVDELLYKHFNEKLTREIEKFGKRKMSQEINLMKQDIKSMYDKCITKLSQSKSYRLSDIVAHDYYTLRSKFEYHLTRQCYELIRWEVQLKMVSRELL